MGLGSSRSTACRRARRLPARPFFGCLVIGPHRLARGILEIRKVASNLMGEGVATPSLGQRNRPAKPKNQNPDSKTANRKTASKNSDPNSEPEKASKQRNPDPKANQDHRGRPLKTPDKRVATYSPLIWGRVPIAESQSDGMAQFRRDPVWTRGCDHCPKTGR